MLWFLETLEIKTMVLSITLLVTVMMSGTPAAEPDTQTVDFADGAQRDAWLRHPVLGDASFDTFEHAATNPICRGTPPYEWPVNGFLFDDPVSGNWYVYVGEYCKGYALDLDAPSRCVAYRSKDQGRTWERIGPILAGEGHVFEGEQAPLDHAPDVSVVYADGRYHLCYDWTTKGTSWKNITNPGPDTNSGVGYAWSDSPEGPFHPTARPLATTRDQVPLQAKYKRLYASTLIRRVNDWLVLTLTDSGPYYGWALLGMTAQDPEGPYTEPKLLLHPECPTFHPPLLEFFPAFVYEGYIYAPATSVALNRNYQAVFRVAIERAMDPKAWELVQHGSVWHAEPVEHEAYGIWGQTFSGFVGPGGMLHVMFPSRDSKGMGTINLAARPWVKPYRDRGFVVSGHEGPSLTLATWGGTIATLDAQVRVNGTVTLLWDYHGPLGADRPTSNATLHPLTLTRYTGLKLSSNGWSILSVDDQGTTVELARGPLESGDLKTRIAMKEDATAVLVLNGDERWRGALPQMIGPVGMLTDAHSHVFVSRLAVAGHPAPAEVSYLYTDALLGAAQRMEDWEDQTTSEFRYGAGALSRGTGVQAKWNFEGTAASLWCPKGPDFGSARVLLDGSSVGEVDCSATQTEPSAPRLTLNGLNPGAHALTLIPAGARFPLDSIEVSR